MNIRFVALDTAEVRALQRGGGDAYGLPAERRVSDGGAIPCRHCLKPVAAGERYLVLAYRPFAQRHAYAETGPIFLHETECERAADTPRPAPMFHRGGAYILRGYGHDDRINYEAAEVAPAAEVGDTAARLLSRDGVAYLHMRSARYNCYQCRIERA